MSILDLEPNETGTVVSIDDTGAIRRRLIDMGLVPSAEVQLERKAPSGNPLWIRVGQTHLALREREAAAVQIQAATK